jgi:hypothetical protein
MRQAAAAEMDGQSVDGRMLSVCFAQKTRKSGGEMVGRAQPVTPPCCLASVDMPCAAGVANRPSCRCSLRLGLFPRGASIAA